MALDVWFPLALMLAGAVVLYLQFFDAFAVPRIDFFAFRMHALRYLQGLPPYSFRWLPMFPLLIGVTSLVMPGPEPVLLAAEIMNLLLAPVCLWLIYRIARQFLSPKASFVVTALCAVNQTMVYSVAQPLLEMLLLTGVLLTIDLSLRGSRWAYAAAFVASMTRYEAALLIPAILLQDLCSERVTEKRLRALLGCLASVGIVAWMALSLHHHRGTINPYVEEMVARSGKPSVFLPGCLRLAVDFLPATVFQLDASRTLLFLGELTLCSVGLVALVRAHRSAVTTLLTFFTTYLLLHTLFPAFLPRYVLPILWILYLAMAKGASALVELARGAISLPRFTRARRWMTNAWMAGLFAYTVIRVIGGAHISRFAFSFFCASALSLWYAAGEPGRRRARVAAWWLPPLALCVALGFGIESSARAMRADAVRNDLAQFRAAGEWYQRVATPDDKMLVPLPWVVDYYSRLSGGQFVYSRLLTSSAIEELTAELRDRGVTYVLWDSGSWGDVDGYHARRFKAPLVSFLRARAPEMLEVAWQLRRGTNRTVVYRFRPHARYP